MIYKIFWKSEEKLFPGIHCESLLSGWLQLLAGTGLELLGLELGRTFFLNTLGPKSRTKGWNIFDFTCLLISFVELSIEYIGRLIENQGGGGATLPVETSLDFSSCSA